MIKIFITGLFFIFSLVISTAQDIQSEDLQALAGEWTGDLTYTDYGDDKKQVTLQTRLEAKVKGGKVSLKYFYTEPNGKVVTGKNTLVLGKDPDKVSFGGVWTVIAFEKKGTSWKLIMERQGKDNNRDSALRQVIEVAGDELSLVKLVRYDGTESFFQRNKYSFSR